jgi:hypothetical protein
MAHYHFHAFALVTTTYVPHDFALPILLNAPSNDHKVLTVLM